MTVKRRTSKFWGLWKWIKVPTCNAKPGATQFVAETNAWLMTCLYHLSVVSMTHRAPKTNPPKTPRARSGTHRDLERNKFTSICSTSREVEICSCSAWFNPSSFMFRLKVERKKKVMDCRVQVPSRDIGYFQVRVFH